MKKEKKRENLVEEINGVPLAMVPIPAGSFTMGSVSAQAADNEKPRREMSLPGFYLGRVTVTKSLWRAVMNQSNTRVNPNNSYPVRGVSWYRAWEFIARLNQRGRMHYRLPTEAEWEYAARAGTRRDRYGPVDEIAWYTLNAGTHPRPVGQKKPNAFGLYDMLGNVLELCSDYYAAYPKYSVDPLGPRQGQKRVLRGGCWCSYPNGSQDEDWVGSCRRFSVSTCHDQGCRASSRSGTMPNEEEDALKWRDTHARQGLRLAADWSENLEPKSLNFRRWLESRFLEDSKQKPALDILALLGRRNLERFWLECNRPDLMLWLYEQVSPNRELREHLREQEKKKKEYSYMKEVQGWRIRARRSRKSLEHIESEANSWDHDIAWGWNVLGSYDTDLQESIAQVWQAAQQCEEPMEKLKLAIRWVCAEVEKRMDESSANSIRRLFPPVQIEGC